MSRRFLIVAAGSVALFLGAASAQAAFQLEPLTSFGGGDGFMSLGEGIFPATADNNQRGVAYNAANNHLYVVNRTGGLTVPILNGDTGAQIGTLDTTGVADRHRTSAKSVLNDVAGCARRTASGLAPQRVDACDDAGARGLAACRPARA